MMTAGSTEVGKESSLSGTRLAKTKKRLLFPSLPRPAGVPHQLLPNPRQTIGLQT